MTKTQATRQSEASAGLSSQIAALQKAQENQKSELEGIIKQQADQLTQAQRQQDALAKKLEEVQET